MADENAANATPQPSVNLVGQYIRDLSFENPNAPASIANSTPPQIQIGINVGVKRQPDDIYAVEITLNAKAERSGDMVFNIELIYGGAYRIRNVPDAQLPPLLLVECPRLIFPFARQVLANTIQAGGFPPVMMEPVDFNAIYLQNLRALQAQQQGGTPAATA
jgi:preprotein translocase subunit SecB